MSALLSLTSPSAWLKMADSSSLVNTEKLPRTKCLGPAVALILCLHYVKVNV